MKRIAFPLLCLLLCCNIAAATEITEIAGDMSVRQFSSDPFFAAKGKYAVGTTFFTWNANDKEGNNYIGQIWYPAEYSASAKKASYLPAAILKTDLPKQIPLLAALESIPTDAMIDAPLLDQNKRYPVLIYSPGLGLAEQAGTFFFEYLASRGFIVAAINHPGSSLFTEKADGSLVLYQEGNYDIPANKTQLTQTRAIQLSCALDALIHLNNTPQSMFYGKIDANTIGVFGHSIGGRSALRAASIDKRFKAAADLDGSIEAELAYTFTNQEILMAQTDVDEIIQAELAEGTTKPEEVPHIKKEYAQYMDNLFNSPHAKKYLFFYNHTRHMNYTDLPILLENPPQIGSADKTLVLLSISKLLDDFFNEAFFPPKASLENKKYQYPYAELKKVKNN